MDATSDRRSCRSSAPSMVTLPRSDADLIGWLCWISIRWLAVSMKPPSPGVDASTKVSGETHSAFAEVRNTCSSVTLCCISLVGSTWTCNCRSRKPQTPTFATPGTLSSRGTMVQRDSSDMSISDCCFEVSPIIMSRPVDEVGCTTSGGRDEAAGNAGAMVRRSCTTCRARTGSVPGSNVISIDDSPGMVCDSSFASHGMPLKNSFSIGLVIRFSTSSADNPSASTCTSTRTGPNSGRASTDVLRSCTKPSASKARATASTKCWYFRLNPTVHRIMSRTLQRNVSRLSSTEHTIPRRAHNRLILLSHRVVCSTANSWLTSQPLLAVGPPTRNRSHWLDAAGQDVEEHHRGEPVDFRLLGPVEVWAGQRRLDAGPRQQRLVLAILALRANQVVPIDQLIGLMWAETPPESARHSIQVRVSLLRALLAEAGADRDEVRIATRGPTYVLHTDPHRIDAHRFRTLVNQAHAEHDDATKAQLLRRALTLWRGPALADVATPQAESLCHGLDEARMVAVEDWVDAALRLGQHDAIIHELTDYAAQHPYRQRL